MIQAVISLKYPKGNYIKLLGSAMNDQKNKPSTSPVMFTVEHLDFELRKRSLEAWGGENPYSNRDEVFFFDNREAALEYCAQRLSHDTCPNVFTLLEWRSNADDSDLLCEIDIAPDGRVNHWRSRRRWVGFPSETQREIIWSERDLFGNPARDARARGIVSSWENDKAIGVDLCIMYKSFAGGTPREFLTRGFTPKKCLQPIRTGAYRISGLDYSLMVLKAFEKEFDRENYHILQSWPIKKTEDS